MTTNKIIPIEHEGAKFNFSTLAKGNFIYEGRGRFLRYLGQPKTLLELIML